MAIQFKKASRKTAKARIALMGPSGSGKTYSALAIASGLGKRVALIDTERGSASKYAGTGKGEFEFDALELESFEIEHYIEAIEAAGASGYDVLIIDSLSHAWNGAGGLLEFVDKEASRSRSQNTFAAWRNATPKQNQLIETILRSPCHIIATMRVKTEYVQEKDERTGKLAPRKVGLAPVQRDGMEYEFDIVGDLDAQHRLCISKTRMLTLDNRVFDNPGAALGREIAAWLESGDPTPAEARQPAQRSADAAVRAQAEKIVARFNDAFGVTREEIWRYFNLSPEMELGTPEVETLSHLGVELRDGVKTADEVFRKKASAAA